MSIEGKDHTNDYGKRCGIEDMLEIHVMKDTRTKQLKDSILEVHVSLLSVITMERKYLLLRISLLSGNY